jgi:hypothetical protein
MDPRCPDCGGTMKRGFLLDQGHGHVYASSWVEGPVERSIWVGVKTRGRAKYSVESFRCEKCGLLKSYAPTKKS